MVLRRILDIQLRVLLRSTSAIRAQNLGPSTSTSLTTVSLSLPRSSVRSSSAFTETDADGPELYDELGSGGSGSKGKHPSPTPKDVKEAVWDGMEMEM